MSDSKSILIVEDEMIIALDIQDTVSERGHRAILAGTLSAAQRLLEARGVDLAILDYHLKDGSTDDLMRQLRDAGIPFIICSGTTKTVVDFPNAPLLAKPFNSDTLLEAVSALAEAQVARCLPAPSAMLPVPNRTL